MSHVDFMNECLYNSYIDSPPPFLSTVASKTRALASFIISYIDCALLCYLCTLMEDQVFSSQKLILLIMITKIVFTQNTIFNDCCWNVQITFVASIISSYYANVEIKHVQQTLTNDITSTNQLQGTHSNFIFKFPVFPVFSPCLTAHYSCANFCDL